MIRGIIALIVIVGFSTACQSRYERFGPYQKYVEGFVKAGKEQGVQISVATLQILPDYKMPMAFGGVCVSSIKVIFINGKVWNQITNSQREGLIWHEMGHCVLGREHETYSLDGVHPGSIMYPSMFRGEALKFYIGNKSYYKRELFHMYPQEGKDKVCLIK